MTPRHSRGADRPKPVVTRVAGEVFGILAIRGLDATCPARFFRANLALGHQQVNNGMPADKTPPARENETRESELWEQPDGERRDTGTAGNASRVDTPLEVVGAVEGDPRGRPRTKANACQNGYRGACQAGATAPNSRVTLSGFFTPSSSGDKCM